MYSLYNIVKNHYLYYKRTSGIVMTLYRVNLKTNKANKIIDLSRGDYSINEYVISGKKLYYNYNNIDNESISRNYVADLNGKKPKTTKTKIVMRNKNSNAKHYSIVKKWNYDKNICYDYLRTPQKTYYLGASK